MSYIMHMSDFHYDGDISEASLLEKRFETLAEHLKKEQRKVNYLVCTGDFIDQRAAIDSFGIALCEKYKDTLEYEYDINNEYRTKELKAAIESLNNDSIINVYNESLQCALKARFNEFSEHFKKFMHAIGIDSKHLIICCGNHDKAWLANSKASNRKNNCAYFDETTQTVKFENPSSAPRDDERCYQAFDEFCEGLGLGYNHGTKLYTIEDDIEFLILNSNASAAYSANMCLNCVELNNTYLNKKHKRHSVFVVHAPYSSFCEEFSLSYHDGEKPNLFKQTVLCSATLGLYGDKHTSNKDIVNNVPFYMVGMFADKNGENSKWECRLIEYNRNSKQYTDSLLKFQGSDWNDDMDLKKAIEVSKLHNVKERIKRLFNSDSSLITVVKGDNDSRLELLSNLFNIVKKYRDFDDSKITRDGNIFECVCKQIETLIESPAEKHLLNIKAACGAGKSSFVYALLVYMLGKYYRSEKPKYIPVLFDAGEPPNNMYISEYNADLKSRWDEFAQSCLALSNKNPSTPIVCLIDGINEISFPGEQCEVLDGIKKLKNEKDDIRFILSINQFSKTMHGYKKINWPQGNHVLYINSVDIDKVENGNTNAMISDAVNELIKLNPDNDVKPEVVVDFLRKIGKSEITLSALHFLIKNECVRNWNTNKEKLEARNIYYKILKDRCVYLFSNTASAVEQMAYEFCYGAIDAQKVQKRYCDFVSIVCNEDLRRCLCAQYIADKCLNDEISKISPRHFSHSVSMLVRCAFIEKCKDSEPESYLSKCVEKCGSSTMPLIAYLIGSCTNGETRDQLLAKIEEKSAPRALFGTEYSDNCYNSVSAHYFSKFSKMFGSDQTTMEEKSNLYKSISELIFNYKARKYYRMFMLEYYEDLANNNVSIKEAYSMSSLNSIKGFDFKRCFTAFITNLTYSTEKFPKEYVLFILCDLVYSRLEFLLSYNGKPKTNEFPFFAVSKNGETIAQRNVLRRTISRIDNYISVDDLANVRDIPHYNAFYYYIKHMQKVFTDCYEIYDQGGDAIEILKKIQMRLHPSYAFRELLKLKWRPRAGWFYSEIFDDMTSEQRSQTIEEVNKQYNANKENDVKETIADHMIESMYIAELYLPEKREAVKAIDGQTKGYDKDKVIIKLLTHEFGKAAAGDRAQEHIHSKDKRDYYREVDCNMYSLMLSGCITGFNSGRKHFDELQSKSKQSSSTHNYTYNDKLAIDIGIIQREYTRKSLVKRGRLELTDKRKQAFESSEEDMTTQVGKRIYAMLITDNPEFSD